MNTAIENIVVTGYAAVSAAGCSIDAITELLHSGRNALTPVPDDVPGGNGQSWGKAIAFKATDFIAPLKARKMDRCSQFAVAASGLALKDACIDLQMIVPERVGIALGCGFGGVANSVEFLTGYFNGGVNGLAPMLFPNTVSNAPASNASIEHGLKGPNVTLVQRFCSAESAFMMACRFIAEGRADIMLTGGADDLMPQMIAGFDAVGQLRRYASCFGEGSGILVLESAKHAASRGVAVKSVVECISTIGVLLKDHEQEGIDKLLADTESSDITSISGTTSDSPLLMHRIPNISSFDLSRVTGRSLAMGGISMAVLLAALKSGQNGLHLASSPEGPYYAIRFSGGNPV